MQIKFDEAETRKFKKIDITPAIIGIILGVVFFVALITAIGIGFLRNVYETLPEPQELADIQPSLVSKVYASDGSLIHEFSIERRFWVPLCSVPENLVNAVIAIEDRRFHSHWGVDLRRNVSAMIGNIINKRYDQGASTITQQLARNVYFTQRKTLMRKVREILTAIQLEKYYTKDEIMELYLNKIYLGGGNYGMSAAARQYFSKTVSELDLNESAVLAGLIQLPEHYRPDRERNLERITVRRRSVLNGMVRAGFIERERADSINSTPIPNNPFVPVAARAPYFVEQVRRELERRYGANMLYNGGLSIFTTLDPQAQLQAEISVRDRLDTLQRAQNRFFIDNAKAFELIGVRRELMMSRFDSVYTAHAEFFNALPDSIRLRQMQASVIALDVETGAVRVMVGGRDFVQSRFNRATQAVRQPGSAFKPFIYAAAMTNGYTAASVVADRPITIVDELRGSTWRPENFDRNFLGDITIREALRRSSNLVAVQVIESVGPEKVVELARSMGLRRNIPPVPALALGTCEATNLELTLAYAAFANQGYRPTEYFIERVADRNGRVIFEHRPEARQVIDPALALLMTSLMQDVVVRGTGASIRSVHQFMRPAAGKTGTTNNYTDAWFIGYTPQIACGVWVGTDRNQSMGAGITGTRGAIPIWAPVMRALHRDLPEESFVYSGRLEVREVCSVSHELASIYCPNPYNEMFLHGITPSDCSVHRMTTRRDASNALDFFGTQAPSRNRTGGGLMF